MPRLNWYKLCIGLVIRTTHANNGMKSTTELDIRLLVKAYDAELKRVMVKRCGCLETAADIVQEAYRRLIDSDRYQRIENPRALLHRIAANIATDLERRNAVRNRFIDQEHGLPEEVACANAVQPDVILSAQERLDKLAALIDSLPPKCRTVFLLRKVEGLSQADIADRLNISRNMVEKHLRHALTLLQQLDND